MSESDTQGTQQQELQFDSADGAAAGVKCCACQAQITDAYYQVNNQVVCATCRTQVEQAFGGGFSMARFIGAVVCGIVAAVLGALIWYAILTFLNMQLGLIAILVGFMVGWAVRFGAQHRGGVPFQLVAVVLTYLAIVSTYVPFIVQGVTGSDDGKESVQASAKAGDPAKPEPVQPSAGKMAVSDISIVGWIVIFGLAMASPFLQGLSNIIGIFIIGIGLYEAWVMNRKAKVAITGPFALSDAAPPISS